MEKVKSTIRRYEARQVRRARYRELCKNGFQYAKISMGGDEYEKYVKSATKLVNDHLQKLQDIAKGRKKAEKKAKDELAKLAKDFVKAVTSKEDVEEKEPVDDHYFYYVMGESYVHGMMDGEAIREKFVRKLRQRVFELR